MLRTQIAQLERALENAQRSSAQVIPLVRPDHLTVSSNPACASAMTPARITPPVLPGEPVAHAAPQPSDSPQHIPLDAALDTADAPPPPPPPADFPTSVEHAQIETLAEPASPEASAQMVEQAPAPAPVPPASLPPTVMPTAANPEEPLSEGNAFAAAWADDQSSFEERFAARQFFHDDGPASPSRKWLLG